MNPEKFSTIYGKEKFYTFLLDNIWLKEADRYVMIKSLSFSLSQQICYALVFWECRIKKHCVTRVQKKLTACETKLSSEPQEVLVTFLSMEMSLVKDLVVGQVYIEETLKTWFRDTLSWGKSITKTTRTHISKLWLFTFKSDNSFQNVKENSF